MSIFEILGFIESSITQALTHKQRAKDKQVRVADEMLRREAWNVHVAAGGEQLVEYQTISDPLNLDKKFIPYFLLANTAPQFYTGDSVIGYRVDAAEVARQNKELMEFVKAAERSIEEAAERAKETAARRIQIRAEETQRKLVDGSTECESPVETIFLRAVISAYQMSFSDGAFRGMAGVFVKKQVEIDKYRVDFLFNDALIVEIDGHEFHSGRNNANRDARRDEVLRALGYNLLRIPAYRVHHNPEVAVSDVRDFLNLLRKV